MSSRAMKQAQNKRMLITEAIFTKVDLKLKREIFLE